MNELYDNYSDAELDQMHERAGRESCALFDELATMRPWGVKYKAMTAEAKRLSAVMHEIGEVIRGRIGDARQRMNDAIAAHDAAVAEDIAIWEAWKIEHMSDAQRAELARQLRVR
jgi:hypothetical protein